VSRCDPDNFAVTVTLVHQRSIPDPLTADRRLGVDPFRLAHTRYGLEVRCDPARAPLRPAAASSSRASMRASSCSRPARTCELGDLPDATPAPPVRVWTGEVPLEEATMRTSPRIREALERVLTSPNWAYSLWYFPVFVRSGIRRPTNTPTTSERSGTRLRRSRACQPVSEQPRPRRALLHRCAGSVRARRRRRRLGPPVPTDVVRAGAPTPRRRLG